MAFVTIALISNSSKTKTVINASEFSFSSKVVGREYPNSVVFDFKIPSSVTTDSLYIQQYWDPTKTIEIRQDQTQATGIYYYPGYFRAKLLVDGQSALEHDLFLKSDNWLGLIEYKPVPKYFKPVLVGESGIRYPKSIFEEVSALEKPVQTSFHFIDDLGNISGDNFMVEAKVRTLFDDRWAVCQAMKLYIIATDGAMVIPFSKLGCSSDNNLMLNDVYLSGKRT